MFIAAMIPRPNAEYAISQAPWQAGSPSNLSSSEVSVGKEGTVDPEAAQRVSDDHPEAPPGSEPGGRQADDAQSVSRTDDAKDGGAAEPGEQGAQRATETEQSDAQGKSSSEDRDVEPSDPSREANANASDPGAAEQPPADAGASPEDPGADAGSPPASVREMFKHPDLSPALQPLQTLVGSLGNVLKLGFYILLALAVMFFAWKQRAAIAHALAEMVRAIRAFFARLFGGAPPARGENPAAPDAAPRRRTFGEYTDPFATGRARSLSPVELVRYTFEAFEAWSGDRGRPRSPDQTPQELVRSVLPPQTPMYDQARRLAQLYSEAAYSAASVTREAAAGLQSFWQMMSS
jgi:hypothetical protein